MHIRPPGVYILFDTVRLSVTWLLQFCQREWLERLLHHLQIQVICPPLMAVTLLKRGHHDNCARYNN